MKTTLTCLLAAAALALAGCGGTDRTEDSANAATKSPATKTTAAATETPDRSLRTITYEGTDGETALDLLRDNGYDVTVESSKLGDYVTAIGDVTSTKSEYWLFEVDGKMPSVGADAYETKDGQQVEWRFGS